MTPGPFPANDAKYGDFAIDTLVKDMIKIGAEQRNLKAKVFGRGKVVEHFSIDIAGANAEFIRRYLSTLKIPVIAEDIGGNHARRVNAMH